MSSLERGPKRIDRQLRRVVRSGRKAAQRFDDRLAADDERVGYGKPCTISVRREAQATVGTHPLARKRASAMTPSAIRAGPTSSMSPHIGLSNRATALAVGSSPPLRGCSKWSKTNCEYIYVEWRCPALARPCRAPKILTAGYVAWLLQRPRLAPQQRGAEPGAPSVYD